jgi:hypothetical protein
MQKGIRRRIAIHRETVRILRQLPDAALQHVHGGSDKTTPDGGCTSSTKHTTDQDV